MKKLLILLSILTFSFAFTACEKPDPNDDNNEDDTREERDEKDDKDDDDEDDEKEKEEDETDKIDLEEGTLGDIIDEMDKLAKEESETAALIGFSNRSNPLEASYQISDYPNPDGSSEFWIAVYTKNPETDFDDDVLDYQKEVFGVEFDQGELRILSLTAPFFNSVNPDQEAGKVAWLGIDTDEMVQKSLDHISQMYGKEEAERNYEDVEFTCLPDWMATDTAGECEINLYEPTDDPDTHKGYYIIMNPATGEITYEEPSVYEYTTY